MNANNLYCISNRKYKFILMLLGIYMCKKKCTMFALHFQVYRIQKINALLYSPSILYVYCVAFLTVCPLAFG